MLKRDERERPDSCWNKSSDGEFVFVLREPDPAIADTIEFWANKRIELGISKATDAKIVGARKEADEIRQRRLSATTTPSTPRPLPEVLITTTPNNYDPLKDEWKWVVNCYYPDGRLASGTVHKDDGSRDVEIDVAKETGKYSKIEVLTWHEAGRPVPQHRARRF